MLSVEEIKKGCKFADGFEYRGETELYFFAHNYRINGGTFKHVVYPLFLQRVIEGINREYRKDDKGYCVAEYISFLSVYHGKREVRETEHFYSDFVTIDQAKEQAINYILGEMR